MDEESEGPFRTDGREKGPGSRVRRVVFFSVWGALIAAILIAFHGILLPFFLAVVVAYVMAPVVGLLQRIHVGTRQLPRWVATVVVYVVLLGLLSLFAALGVPRLVVEIQRLARDAPAVVTTIRDEWLPELEVRLRAAMAPYEDASGADEEPTEQPVEIPVPPDTAIRVVTSEDGYRVEIPRGGILVTPRGDGYAIEPAHTRGTDTRSDLTAVITDAVRRAMENTGQHAATLVSTVNTVTRAVVKSVFTFFIMLMLSAYLLITSDRIFAFARSLVRPQRRRNFDRLLLRIDRGLGGVVRGQLLIALVNGVLSGIGFYALGLNYWPILTLIATVFSIIPIFGAILSTIPAVIIGLQDGIGTAALVLLWILVIHQIEANVLNPKIMGDQAKVHPVLVVFALLAGEHVGGIAGALLAVPVLSVVQSLFLHYRDVALSPGRAKAATDSDY